MEFHHYGYANADPRIEPAAGAGLDRPDELPEHVDVLIVGSGPAGMIAAAQLAQFPDVTTRIIEQREGRLEIGQADGIQARSVETFEAFGFAQRLVQEAYQLTDTEFWTPDPAAPGCIVRSATTPDTLVGVSEYPQLIVNQARVADYLAEFAANSPARVRVDYGLQFVDLRADGDGGMVEVRLRTSSGELRTVRARYVIGADGARSRVRAAIGGALHGDQAFHAWGVMDVLVDTDFPDIRRKSIIQSSDGGNILLIPREGNHLVRMYVDLGEVGADAEHDVRTTPIETIIERAAAILAPYRLDVKHVAWSSVYEVAHRLTDRFDNAPDEGAPNVFLAGDACHTHSAKAGQGMNVSLQDGWNLAWKLGQVASGIAPAELLRTYSDERRVIARDLIDFDKRWSTLMAKRPEEFASPSELEDFYLATAEFPAGFMTKYTASIVTGAPAHQELASGYVIGKRFRSAEVMRVSDAVRIHLGHEHRADGRYRIYAFADAGAIRLREWAEWMRTDEDSPVRRFTPPDGDEDARFDVKLISPEPYREIELAEVPELFFPRRGPYRLKSYEKVFAAIPGESIFRERGVAADGAVVIVRPDQYVSHVLPLTARAELTEHFDRLLIPRS